MRGLSLCLVVWLAGAGKLHAQAVPFGPPGPPPQMPGGGLAGGGSVNVDPDLYQWSVVYDGAGKAVAIVSDTALADYTPPAGAVVRHAKDVYGVQAAAGKKVAAKAGCDCGPGCACPAGVCASGACGTQPIGTQAAPGTVLVEQTVQRADGSTYTRIVERPAGYVPMSGVRQSQQSGPLASGTAPRPHAAGTEDHTHTCPRCGTTWGGRGHSHSCPRCGTPQYVQDQPGYAPAYYPGRPGYAAQGGVTYPQPVQYQPQYRPIYSFGGGGCASGGCANGACGVPQFSPWR